MLALRGLHDLDRRLADQTPSASMPLATKSPMSTVGCCCGQSRKRLALPPRRQSHPRAPTERSVSLSAYSALPIAIRALPIAIRPALVYKNGDARVPQCARRSKKIRIAAVRCGQELMDIYETLAKARYDAKGLHPNLDYPAYHLIGFDTPTFIPTFVAARLPGWPVHIAEQLTANSLIRLLAAYSGTAECHLS